MKEQIGADNWTIETLLHGLKVVLKEEPKPFEKENNNSARKYMKILKEKVVEWETKGYVKKLSFKPKSVNAMSVIRQENSTTKEIKFRPVIDMKTINNLVLCEKTKLDDLFSCEIASRLDQIFWFQSSGRARRKNLLSIHNYVLWIQSSSASGHETHKTIESLNKELEQLST